MAKSKETYNKKEKEKKRLKQKQEKKERMEERKANKKEGNSLDDMLAYVDENGNLSDKPVLPSRRNEIKLEDIQVGVVRREEREEDNARTGKITFFNTAKGFGFINDTTSNERIFFHVNDLVDNLQEFDNVNFIIGRGPKGLMALQVSKAR